MLADHIDRLAIGFEKSHGVPDSGVLQVGMGPAAGGGGEPARQGPFAEPEPRREFGCSDRVLQMEVDVLLDLVNDGVAMRPFPAERYIWALAWPVAVDQQNLGGLISAVVTRETLHDVEHQVQK